MTLILRPIVSNSHPKISFPSSVASARPLPKTLEGIPLNQCGRRDSRVTLFPPTRLFDGRSPTFDPGLVIDSRFGLSLFWSGSEDGDGRVVGFSNLLDVT